MAASEATSRDAVRILVVDDDPLFKALARRLLRRYDYEPVEASNSAEAIRLLDSHRPQVVLLDHRLGDEDGRVVLPRLRAHAPNVPVILVTGNNSVDVAVECIKLGAFDFLTKPLDEPRFVASVAKACEHHRLLERVRQWEAGNGDESGFEDLIGTS
ncbi:MAG: response regulator, partial [Phycisphaerales bacterium]|nr:response regulator [Phycisphaerales bacterium]